MRYDIVTAEHMSDKSLGIANFSGMVDKGLITKVNNKLAEGWRPQGGPKRIVDKDGNQLLIQAITLKTCECDPLPCPDLEIERH